MAQTGGVIFSYQRSGQLTEMGGDFTKMAVTDYHVMCIPPTVTRHHVTRIPFEDDGLFVRESIV